MITDEVILGTAVTLPLLPALPSVPKLDFRLVCSLVPPPRGTLRLAELSYLSHDECGDPLPLRRNARRSGRGDVTRTWTGDPRVSMECDRQKASSLDTVKLGLRKSPSSKLRARND